MKEHYIDGTKVTIDDFVKAYNTGNYIHTTLNGNEFLRFSQNKYLETLRKKRKKLLEAFDKWEKGVLRGREVEDTNIMQWYQKLLNLDSNAFLNTNIPLRIKYYL